MSNWSYRPVRDAGDRAAIEDAIYQSFFGFGRPRSAMTESMDWLGQDNMRVIADDQRIAGGLALLPFGQWFGGRAVPSIGLSVVAIFPEFRGTGAGKFLIEQTVREMAATGAPLSVLYPSTWAFYRHAGYEPAGARTTYKLNLRNFGAREMDYEMRPMRDDERPAVEQLYEQIARTQGGTAHRSETNWNRIFKAKPEDPYYRYVVDGPDGMAGYLIYTQESVPHQPSELDIRDWCWRDEKAGRRILTFLQQHAILAETIWYDGAPVDPLLALGRVENLKVEYNHYWMLRILNLEAALTARGYPAALRGTLEIGFEDPLLTENTGNFVVEVADGVAEVRPGGGGGLQMGPRGLAPLYTGHLSAEDLRRMGLVAGDDASCALATQIFSGPRPWMSDRF